MKTQAVLVALTLILLGLQDLFHRDFWFQPPSFPTWPAVDPALIQPTTVRKSAAERLKAGPVDDFDCYTCHEKGKEPEVKFGPNNQVILPEEHKDMVIQHGRYNRNSNCYNCHDHSKLDQLRTRDGRVLTFSQSTLLCAGCHGPTYRDWEIGIHGRLNGYWNRALGTATRKDCTSCHNPHAPLFPALAPLPGPRLLHAAAQPPS